MNIAPYRRSSKHQCPSRFVGQQLLVAYDLTSQRQDTTNKLDELIETLRRFP